MHFHAIQDAIPFILGGIVVTLKFTLLALTFGLPLAIFIALGRLSTIKALKLFCQFYVSLFRGTPLLVQLVLFYYSIPQITGYAITAFEAGLLTFSLNTAAYSSEVIRSGIQVIDKGQWEAARMVGLTPFQTFSKIILPQAVRNVLPSLVNETVDLLKESALVSVIGEMDLYRRAQMVASETFLYFEPLIVCAASYYVMVLVISTFANYLERRLRVGR
jgi:His/Glu/Gln/Arg/opine family amino acid ABC transporter permease subunit